MKLAEIKDYLKSRISCDNWYVGKIDAGKEYCIGVYSSEGPVPVIPIGGVKNLSYSTKAVSFLIHWGRSYTPAEEKALEVFECLFPRPEEFEDYEIIKVDFRTSEPVGIGTDERGIYEFIINCLIFYKRKGE